MSDPGALVGGRYRLVERVGAGAMGVVWLARDERLGRSVALKQLVPAPAGAHGAASRSEAAERAMREGRIAARLHHQNAISVFDVTDHGGTPWLVMEYLPSRSLAAVLAERGALPPREVAGIGRQLADALVAAHAAGIVHRDIKPGNVLLGDGVAKLTDFGISRATGDVTLTSTGMVAGTPAYLAPEIARGVPPSPASDVFALGATLYAAVEGQPPFGAHGNPLALLHQVAGGHVLPPRQAGPLTALLMQLLHAEPAQRPTMAQAGVALAAIAEGRPVPMAGPAAFGAPPLNGGAGFGDPTVVAGAEPAAMRTMVGLPPAGLTPDGVPQDPGERDRRPALLIAAGVALAVLASLLVLAATTGPDRPSRPAAAPTLSTTAEPATTVATTTAPTTTPSPVSAAELQRAVTEYYALLPRHPDQAWARLGPALQAGGFGPYRQFWQAVEAVQATVTSADPATMTVRVFLVYRRDDRRPQGEVRDLVLVRSGDALFIDGDTKIGGAPAVPTTTRKRRG